MTRPRSRVQVSVRVTSTGHRATAVCYSLLSNFSGSGFEGSCNDLRKIESVMCEWLCKITSLEKNMFSPHARAIAPFSLFPKRRDEVKTSGPRERTIGIVRKAHQKSNEDCIQLD